MTRKVGDTELEAGDGPHHRVQRGREAQQSEAVLGTVRARVAYQEGSDSNRP